MGSENKIFHLNMIQQTITRMSNNSFSLKGWAVGIMIAIYSFAGENTYKAVVVTLIPLIVFWLLDGYYLTLERKFRELYNNIRLREEKTIDFDMSYENIVINIKDIKKYCFISAFLSKTILPFYLVCIITTLIIYFVKL